MTNNPKHIPIQVSARILRHVSRGIYRTPAGALKELISNAYDAGAKKITINTGYPIFEKITATDNGNGMTKNVFEALIQNIGFSDKVAGTEFEVSGLKSKRVTIGHYGIGMLAIGQLCSKAIITSKVEGSLEGFEATIDFEQFEVKAIDGIERSETLDEKSFEEKDKKISDLQKEENKKFSIGKCAIKDLKYSQNDKSTHFTKIELTETRNFVQRKLSGSLRESYEDLKTDKKYVADFNKVIEIFRKHEEDIRRGQYPYEKLLWELSLYSPIKYSKLPVFDDKLSHFKILANSHNFEVVVDGMEIHKPLERDFFDNKEYPVREVFAWKDENYSNSKTTKKVSGYLIYRQHIRPKLMQGVLLREAGVAIGMYDLTFMEYPYHEATKFEQLSGELFVEGLSGSLNIDRNSFNETDDTYLALVKWFHAKLRKEVFPKIQKYAKQKREDATELFEKLSNHYFKKFNSGYKVVFKALEKNKTLFLKDSKILYINKNHPQGKPRKSAIDKLFLASFLVVSGEISPEKMEEILNNIAEVKK